MFYDTSPTRTVVVQGPPVMPHGVTGITGPSLCGTNLTLCDVVQLTEYGYIPSNNLSSLPPNQAFDTFIQTTGFVPYNFDRLSTTLDDNNTALINSITYYLFYPIIILTVFIIWVAIIWGGIRWEIGLFLTILVVVVLLTANIVFRQQAGGTIKNNNSTLSSELSQTQSAQQASVGYWPQGLAAISSLWRNGSSGPTGVTGSLPMNNGGMNTYPPMNNNGGMNNMGSTGPTGDQPSVPSWMSFSESSQRGYVPSVSTCRSCPRSLNRASTSSTVRRGRR